MADSLKTSETHNGSDMYISYAPFRTANELCEYATHKFGIKVTEGDLIRGSGQHPPSGHVTLPLDIQTTWLNNSPVIVLAYSSLLILKIIVYLFSFPFHLGNWW